MVTSKDRILWQTKRDRSLPDEIHRILNERDAALALASEIVSTILLEANTHLMTEAVRKICQKSWLPQLVAINKGVQLTDEEVRIALTTSGVDIEKIYPKLKALLEKYALQNQDSRD